jgi:hypothetical protein
MFAFSRCLTPTGHVVIINRVIIQKIHVSHLIKDTVKIKMKTTLPIRPPTIVMYSDAANCCLKICIPAKHDKARVKDITPETPVDKPVIKVRCN